ncbi:MAG TPA: cytochrome d ubiquinol oxidase subunit II [Sunxiuqinia sp.]|nr:cytochrome d ubiquinol oxidase subunit II [Sunxiuqinia sp.]
MTEIIITILGICVLLYVLLGGADFGGGILELITKGKDKGIVAKAIAPVWEANHMWLILVVVILFVGYPDVYSTVMTTLHIPVLAVLIGIIFRGSAFTFRHYDIKEERPKAIYSSIFRYSSLFTTFFLGMTLAGIILGDITNDYSQGFYRVYMHPWLNWFGLSLGFFMVILFSFLATIYTIGELKENRQIEQFTRTARSLLISLVVVGFLVFLAADYEGLNLFYEFYHSSASIVSVVLATVALPFLWTSLKKRQKNRARLIAGFQTTMIVVGWFAIQFPVLVKMSNGNDITLHGASAPASTQLQLLIALVVGVLIIFPAMGYLYKTFKFNEKSTNN